MTNRPPSTIDRVLGAVGLFLILVVGTLANRGYSAQPTIGGRLAGFLARRAIERVALIGWLVDRLPLGPLDASPHAQAARQKRPSRNTRLA